MIFASPGDVAFNVFGFPVYYYGIILAVSCLLAVVVARYLYQFIYSDNKAQKLWDVAPFVVILGILGARLYYCLLNIGDYISNPLGIFMIREGGLSIHGGIIAGILGLYIASKRYEIPFLRLLDVFSVGTILAQSFGRWGNFFNNEAFGIPTDGWLKLYIPEASRPEYFTKFEYFHPTFLYESVLNFLLFVILIFVIKRFGVKFEGLTFGLYLALYSLIRFFIEGIRLDSALNVGDFHIAQIISVLIFVAALIFIACLLIKSRNLSDWFLAVLFYNSAYERRRNKKEPHIVAWRCTFY